MIWDQAFYSNNLFNQATRERLFERQPNTHYSLGWDVDSLGKFARSYHDGGITEFSTSLQRIPAKKLTVIAISNTGNDNAIKVAYDIAGKFCSYPATIRGIQVELEKQNSKILFELISRAKAAFPRFRINEKLVQQVADELKKQGQVKQAVELYTLNTLLYPNSQSALQQLAEARKALNVIIHE